MKRIERVSEVGEVIRWSNITPHTVSYVITKQIYYENQVKARLRLLNIL